MDRRIFLSLWRACFYSYPSQQSRLVAVRVLYCLSVRNGNTVRPILPVSRDSNGSR